MATEAEIDNVLDQLDLFASENGGGREQACFHAAKIIREMRTAGQRLNDAAFNAGSLETCECFIDDATRTAIDVNWRTARAAFGLSDPTE